MVLINQFEDQNAMDDLRFIHLFLAPCSGIWDFLRRNTLQRTAGLRLSTGFGMEKKITGTTRHWKMSGELISEIT